jgi:trans-aconitate methyltransferase
VGFLGEFEASYKNGASLYVDAWLQGNVRAHPTFDALAGVTATQVVDFGCGKGTLTGAIRQTNSAYFIRGIDGSPAAVRIAKNRYGGIKFQVANLPRAILRYGSRVS